MVKYSIGDTVLSKKYGKGTIVDIDLTNFEFRYNVKFNDGTGAWTSGRDFRKVF